MSTTGTQDAKIVVIEYERLLQPYDDELDALVEEAYGPNGLGVLAVANAPGYLELRNNLLPMGYQFGQLPEEIKARYVHNESNYSFGWSHGKERLAGGKPDIAKGSYYANPQYNDPANGDNELIEKYIATLHPNIWPTSTDFEPNLEEAFMALGNNIVSVGYLIAQLCDEYCLKRNPNFPKGRLTNVLKTSKCAKARLLYYFPHNNDQDDNNTDDEKSVFEEGSWCSPHLDSGSLTGLTSALFFDTDGKEIPNPDPKAGLYIKARDGREYHAKIPSDCIAYQVGECFQVHSGLLQPTPHAVRACKQPGVSRSTFACFMQPQYDHKMDLPPGADLDQVEKGANGQQLPAGVPSLLSRWDINGTQTYGEFAEKTFSMYY
jgi:isopenicillin N synthase-like dioxygenase